MPQGQVFYATHADLHVLKFVGDIRFGICAPVERYLKEVIGAGQRHHFLVDLLDTDSIDSTGLGVLAMIARHAQAAQAPKPTLLATSPDLLIVLNSVCFDRVFTIVRAPGQNLPERFQALAGEPAAQEEFAAHALRTHRELMALSQENRETFKDVVALMEREQGAEPRL